VFILNSDTTENQLGILGLIHLFSANGALSNFAQINEDLAVKHTVCVQVHELRSA
jgi:hypothetical protein